MRSWLCLALVALLVGSVQAADRPERLSDRPNPSVKLVPALGWRLSAVAMTDVENGVEVLTVEGDVFNAADSERASPKVRLAVLDGAGHEIFHWTVVTDLERIKAGDYAPFRARLESPPEGIEGVVVSTVEADAQFD